MFGTLTSQAAELLYLSASVAIIWGRRSWAQGIFHASLDFNVRPSEVTAGLSLAAFAGVTWGGKGGRAMLASAWPGKNRCDYDETLLRVSQLAWAMAMPAWLVVGSALISFSERTS